MNYVARGSERENKWCLTKLYIIIIVSTQLIGTTTAHNILYIITVRNIVGGFQNFLETIYIVCRGRCLKRVKLALDCCGRYGLDLSIPRYYVLQFL